MKDTKRIPGRFFREPLIVLCCIATSLAFAPADQPADQPDLFPPLQNSNLSAPSGRHPRIAMFWSPADISADRWENIARHDVVVLNLEQLGLTWRPFKYPGMVETIEPAGKALARRNIDCLLRANPSVRIYCQVFFYEQPQDYFPPDHLWWLVDENSRRVQFWPGSYLMDISNVQYIAHVARRIAAVHRAFDGRVGVFLDNLRQEPKSRQAWLSLIAQARELAGQDLKIMVNAGWFLEDLKWIAPHVNGFLFENAINHSSAGDAIGFYRRLADIEQMTLTPRANVNEVFGPRDDRLTMGRELVRTLVYTDCAYLYADSTDAHAHGWFEAWDARLGAAVDPPHPVTDDGLAVRRFERGLAAYLPDLAAGPAIIPLEKPMRDLLLDNGGAVSEIILKPGQAVLMVDINN